MAEVEDWKERYLAAAKNALRARLKDDEALKDEQIKKLKQKVGELVLDIDILKEAQKGRPFGRGTSGERTTPMPEVSIRRICRMLEVSCSPPN